MQSMTIEELEKFMIENAITIRAIPLKIVEYWSIQNKNIHKYKDEEIFYFDKWGNPSDDGRPFERVVREPKMGGKFVVLHNCGTGEMMSWKGVKYFNSIEDAIKSIQGEK